MDIHECMHTYSFFCGASSIFWTQMTAEYFSKFTSNHVFVWPSHVPGSQGVGLRLKALGDQPPSDRSPASLSPPGLCTPLPLLGASFLASGSACHCSRHSFLGPGNSMQYTAPAPATVTAGFLVSPSG